MSVLLVEDDPSLRHMIRLLLQRAGYDIMEAEDGFQALELVKRHNMQLIVTDWMMPRMDGQELIRRIRAVESDSYTYIIMLTARGQPQDIVQGLETGADDYIVKPFNPRELQARVAIGERFLRIERELRATRDRLQLLATRDDLTGLLNRKAIFERAQIELERTARERVPTTLLLLDLDYFKAINDQYGHLIGDRVLQFVTSEIQSILRPTDYVGRWGGEEFLIVLPRTSLVQGANVAERLRHHVEESSFWLEVEHRIRLSASLGVVEAPIGQRSALDTLLQSADQALYRAKQLGRNRVALFSEMA